MDDRLVSVASSSVAVASATVGGSVEGILIAHHRGAPVWLLLLAIGGSLTFGLISSSFRPTDDAERLTMIKHNFFNSGALWVAACCIVWTMGLHFSTAMVVSLILGLFGTQFLDAMEETITTKLLIDKLAKWWLGGG